MGISCGVFSYHKTVHFRNFLNFDSIDLQRDGMSAEFGAIDTCLCDA